MKIYKLFLTLLVATAFIACSEFEDVVVPSPAVADGVQAVRFAPSNKVAFELDPSKELSVSLLLIRNKATAGAAGSFPIEVVSNKDDNFVIPATVSFAAGDTTATIKVMVGSKAPAGADISFGIKVADQNVNPYKTEYGSYYGKVIVVKWNDLGVGVFYDSFAFGTEKVSYAVSVNVQQRDDKKTIYRVNNPYSTAVLNAADWGNWIGGLSQPYILFTVGAVNVTWDNFWYTGLIYNGNAGQYVKAYLPSAIKKTDDKKSIVKKDATGKIQYLELNPSYYVDGVGGWGMNPTYVGFPGYDLVKELNLTLVK